MILSNVIVDVRISRRSFVLGQSRAKVSAGFLKKTYYNLWLKKKTKAKGWNAKESKTPYESRSPKVLR